MILLWFCWWLPFSPPVHSNGDTAKTPVEVITSGKAYMVRYQTTPGQIPMNQPFEIEVWLATPDGPLTTQPQFQVDARMPEHRHGMVRTPQITVLGENHYLIKGMLFHMPGRWELYFDITDKYFTERATVEVFLE